MYHWQRRASELELAIEDRSIETIFVEALMALGDELSEIRGGEAVTHEIELSASDQPALLGAWVNELVRLAETDGFIPERVLSLELGANRLAAVVGGQRSLPAGAIKAVAYDRLQIEPIDGAWLARVVLSLQ